MSSSTSIPSAAADGAAGESAVSVSAGGSSSVEPSLQEQLMRNIEEKCPPSLDQRLHTMDEVDQRIDELLGVVAEVLGGLDKDKPLSKAKMEELYKKYELRLDDVQRGIGEQLTYMEQVCVGAEHQGSTFHYHQMAELSAARLQSLHAHLAMLRNNDDGERAVEEQAVSETAAEDEQCKSDGQSEAMEQ